MFSGSEWIVKGFFLILDKSVHKLKKENVAGGKVLFLNVAI